MIVITFRTLFHVEPEKRLNSHLDDFIVMRVNGGGNDSCWIGQHVTYSQLNKGETAYRGVIDSDSSYLSEFKAYFDFPEALVNHFLSDSNDPLWTSFHGAQLEPKLNTVVATIAKTWPDWSARLHERKRIQAWLQTQRCYIDVTCP